MPRALPSQLTARRLATRKAKAEKPSGQDRTPLHARRQPMPPQPHRLVSDLGAKFANLLTELPGQVSGRDGAFGKSNGSGTDADAFAQATHHQALDTELGHHRP